MRRGLIYTETVVHAAPEPFIAEAPYQVAIVALEDGSRVTARIEGERVAIDDMVIEAVSDDNEIPHFKKL